MAERTADGVYENDKTFLRRPLSEAWHAAAKVSEALARPSGGAGSLQVTRFELAAWLRAYLLNHLWRDPSLTRLRSQYHESISFDLNAVVVLLALATLEAVQCSESGFTREFLDGIVSDVIEPYIQDYFEFAPASVPTPDKFIDQWLTEWANAGEPWPQFFNDETLQLIRTRLKRRTWRDIEECVAAAWHESELAIVACEIMTGTYGDLPYVHEFISAHRREFRDTFRQLHMT